MCCIGSHECSHDWKYVGGCAHMKLCQEGTWTCSLRCLQPVLVSSLFSLSFSRWSSRGVIGDINWVFRLVSGRESCLASWCQYQGVWFSPLFISFGFKFIVIGFISPSLNSLSWDRLQEVLKIVQRSPVLHHPLCIFCVCLFCAHGSMDVCVPCVCLCCVSSEARRGHWVTWN